MSDLLDALNDEQRLAVENFEGYVRLHAGAGTGKTRTLTYRYAYLVSVLGIPPKSVWCCTFTNKAASEMKERIISLCGDVGEPFVSTFHSFCVSFLKEEIIAVGWPKNFSIWDVNSVKSVLRPIYEECGIDGREFPIRKAWDYIDSFKEEQSYIPDLINADTSQLIVRSDLSKELGPKIFWRYLFAQRTSYALDFDDLILFTLHILRHYPEIRARWQERLEFIMVDEFQDIDRDQYELVEILAGKHHNLFIVGDPDQTIYSWRGARVNYFNDFVLRHGGKPQVIDPLETEAVVLALDQASAMLERPLEGLASPTERGVSPRERAATSSLDSQEASKMVLSEPSKYLQGENKLSSYPPYNAADDGAVNNPQAYEHTADKFNSARPLKQDLAMAQGSFRNFASQGAQDRANFAQAALEHTYPNHLSQARSIQDRSFLESEQARVAQGRSTQERAYAPQAYEGQVYHQAHKSDALQGNYAYYAKQPRAVDPYAPRAGDQPTGRYATSFEQALSRGSQDLTQRQEHELASKQYKFGSYAGKQPLEQPYPAQDPYAYYHEHSKAQVGDYVHGRQEHLVQQGRYRQHPSYDDNTLQTRGSRGESSAFARSTQGELSAAYPEQARYVNQRLDQRSVRNLSPSAQELSYKRQATSPLAPSQYEIQGQLERQRQYERQAPEHYAPHAYQAYSAKSYDFTAQRASDYRGQDSAHAPTPYAALARGGLDHFESTTEQRNKLLDHAFDNASNQQHSFAAFAAQHSRFAQPYHQQEDRSASSENLWPQDEQEPVDVQARTSPCVKNLTSYEEHEQAFRELDDFRQSFNDPLDQAMAQTSAIHTSAAALGSSKSSELAAPAPEEVADTQLSLDSTSAQNSLAAYKVKAEESLDPDMTSKTEVSADTVVSVESAEIVASATTKEDKGDIGVESVTIEDTAAKEDVSGEDSPANPTTVEEKTAIEEKTVKEDATGAGAVTSDELEHAVSAESKVESVQAEQGKEHTLATLPKKKRNKHKEQVKFYESMFNKPPVAVNLSDFKAQMQNTTQSFNQEHELAQPDDATDKARPDVESMAAHDIQSAKTLYPESMPDASQAEPVSYGAHEPWQTEKPNELSYTSSFAVFARDNRNINDECDLNLWLENTAQSINKVAPLVGALEFGNNEQDESQYKQPALAPRRTVRMAAKDKAELMRKRSGKAQHSNW